MYAAANQQTSGKAIASLVCGIVNVFPLSLVAVILGHISISEMRRSAGRLKGQGMAIAGLVLGYLGLVAIPFVLIIAAIAIPGFIHARIAANQAAALASLRTIYAAEVRYQADHPNAGFTCNLSDLSSAGLIDANLGSGQKFGYAFSLQNCMAKQQAGPIMAFQLAASPLKRNTTGIAAFCTNETGAFGSDGGGSVEDCFARAAAMH